jgi:GGDEF domain-containing protein
VTELPPRAWYFGPAGPARQQLAALLGLEFQAGAPVETTRRDVVFLDSSASPEALEHLGANNAFAACRRLKDRQALRVVLLVQDGDEISPEIGRFCLADDSFHVLDGGLVESRDALRERLLLPRGPKVAVDSLLARLEKDLSSDAGRQGSILQRMLAAGEEPTFLDRLVDQETGLFDGPYASFKLDEEFKRSRRFHQPLSLLLLSLGIEEEHADADPVERRRLLADAASVFLNECRDIDVIARFTMDTFLILMPGTGAAGGAILGRRMLDELRRNPSVARSGARPVAGLATMPAAGIPNRQTFLARAEACLRVAQDEATSEGFCSSSE